MSLLATLLLLAAPVDLSADGLEIDLKSNVGAARGNVLIQREDMTVCCDEAEARYSGRDIEWVECRGRVVILRPDGTRARADVAVLDFDTQKLRLSGKARFRSKNADVRGPLMIYDMKLDSLEVRRGGDAGRKTRMRYSPTEQGPMPLERQCPPPS